MVLLTSGSRKPKLHDCVVFLGKPSVGLFGAIDWRCSKLEGKLWFGGEISSGSSRNKQEDLRGRNSSLTVYFFVISRINAVQWNV
jgi:hypothetical protein